MDINSTAVPVNITTDSYEEFVQQQIEREKMLKEKSSPKVERKRRKTLESCANSTSIVCSSEFGEKSETPGMMLELKTFTEVSECSCVCSVLVFTLIIDLRYRRASCE